MLAANTPVKWSQTITISLAELECARNAEFDHIADGKLATWTLFI